MMTELLVGQNTHVRIAVILNSVLLFNQINNFQLERKHGHDIPLLNASHIAEKYNLQT